MHKLLRIEHLFSVAGKRVLITGGGRGLGHMMAAGFVANGAHVVIASRDAKTTAATAEALADAGPGRCVALTADLTSRAGCEQLAVDWATAFGDEAGGAAPCDVLINNSGASWGEDIARTSGKMNWGWDKVLDLNVKGPFYLTRAMLPHLDAASAASAAATTDALAEAAAPGGGDDRDDSGDALALAPTPSPARVINVGSVAGIHPQNVPTHAYDVSKAALHHLTRKLAAEFARRGGGDAADHSITVNAIAPGFVPSRMSAGLAAWGADTAALKSVIPLQRWGDARDIAGAALYLASPAAAWVTGVIVPVDGGSTGTVSSAVMDD